MITVLLVDDHTLIRDGLRRLLQDNPDIQVVGEASDGQEALRLLRQLQPDVAVMDLSMPGLDGMEATKRALSEGLTTRMLILTMHANEEYAIRVLQAGARGFIGKGAPSEEVVAAIRKVASGRCYLPVAFSETLPKLYASKGTGESPLKILSTRELQVLKRLAEGRTSKEIAQDLYLSAKTVDTYRARLLTKLKLETTADLIRFALRHGVIEDAW
ncbi:MAG: response regulator transcription factor [Deltaproteobacteria bacterium]|nr:response regulator transcription factor [Deltaproteobacteria bacterium]